MIMLLCWMPNTVFLTFYLFWRSIIEAMELNLDDSIFSFPFVCAVITSFFHNKEIIIRVILLLDFLRFVATQVYRLTRSLLIGELYDEEFERLRGEFTVFHISRLFFLLFCQPTLCIYETSIWLVWFGYVLLVKIIYLLCKMKAKRLDAQEEGAATKAMRGRLILFLLTLLVVSLLITLLVANIFQEAPYHYKVICAIEVFSWCTQIILKVINLLSMQYNVFNLRAMMDDLETIIVHCFQLISFSHYWFLHRVFSPIGLAFAYEVSTVVEKVAKFFELLHALETIDRFPSTKNVDLCTICQCPLMDGKLLPCEHAFHEDCLRAWLRVKNECPNCRQRIYFPQLDDSPEDLGQETNEGVGVGLNQAAPRSNITMHTDRYELNLFIDLFSLLRPFYIGFTYERQRPWVPDVSEPESSSFNPEDLPENSDRDEQPESISYESEPVELDIDIVEQTSNAESVETNFVENDPQGNGSLVQDHVMWSYAPWFFCRCFSEEVEEDTVLRAEERDPVEEVLAMFEG